MAAGATLIEALRSGGVGAAEGGLVGAWESKAQVPLRSAHCSVGALLGAAGPSVM